MLNDANLNYNLGHCAFMKDIKDLIATLKTAEECLTLEKNAKERGKSELAIAASKRAIQIQTQKHGATKEVERECIEAIYAYERALSQSAGKSRKASRTWPMLARHG